MKNIIGKSVIENERKEAKHGEFFFANFLINNGEIRKSPVFILSNKIDNNDDVVICSCTKQPAKSQFDIPVKLKYKTYVRTNKIYTIHRDNLAFKINNAKISQAEYNEIVNKVKLALDLK
ncbi:type II toxin-antitoxin system PemK/MazF family toxin [Clostridium sporogenes]